MLWDSNSDPSVKDAEKWGKRVVKKVTKSRFESGWLF